MKPSPSIWRLLTLFVLVLPTLYLLWAWPSLPLGTYLLLAALPRFDPRRRLAADSRSPHKLTLLLVGGLSALACYSLYLALHPERLPDWEMGIGISLFSP
jgi:hypothetical protein